MDHTHHVLVDRVTWAEAPEAVETTQYYGDLNTIRDIVLNLKKNERRDISIYTDYCCEEMKTIAEGDTNG